MSRLLLARMYLPFVLGFFSFIVPRKNKGIPVLLAVVASTLTFVICIKIFLLRSSLSNLSQTQYLWLDNLSAFVTLFIGFFGLIIVIYSLGFMKDKDNLNKYYAYVLWTISASLGVAMSNHLVLFLTFWGILGITLYLLIAMGSEGAASSAKKAFVIIGGSDSLILLGIVIIGRLTSSLFMNQPSIALDSNLATLAFLCLALGAFAKAGAMPLHTWIPACAETAPTPVMAFLPASLD